jgi:hypothetical protein
MKLIEQKKKPYPVSTALSSYLASYSRVTRLPIEYGDLKRFTSSVALYDKNGEDTLWSTVGYDAPQRREVHKQLLEIYAILRSEGDLSVMDHLEVDRIDLCLYGNSQPFRIRIINTLNDNFDYFYVKLADASRLYGLELEEVLSPNRIGFLMQGNTLIEEHIYGIPGDMFINKYMQSNLNEVRLAKEFVKFNERCFLRLLGDMHSANFVVDIHIDFEENNYRMRAIDFDQQSYEPRRQVYLPQYYKENNPIIALGMKHLTWESVRQYQREERALIHKRMHAARRRFDALMSVMEQDVIAPAEYVAQLGDELAEHYADAGFAACQTMGQLVRRSLATLER